MTASTLPTLDEVPPVPIRYRRDMPNFLRLSLIPHDDAELRALALREFNLSEHLANEVDTSGDEEAWQPIQTEKSHVPARTPGGLAWKISDVIDFFDVEIRDGRKHYPWWYHVLESAMSDALDLERKRQAAYATESLFELLRQCEDSQARIRLLEKTRDESDPEVEREWQAALDYENALHQKVSETPATTLTGVAIKTLIAGLIIRIAYPNGAEGETAEFLDDDERVILSAADDAKRLLGGERSSALGV